MTKDEAEKHQAELIADLDELEALIDNLKDKHAAMLLELAGHIAQHGYTKIRD